MSTRRRKGEGSITRYHNHPSCPKSIKLLDESGKTVTVMPDHDCKGPYRARLWVTATDGKKVRKTVYGKTEKKVLKGVRKLQTEADRNEVLAESITVEAWMRTDAASLGLRNWWTIAVEGKLKETTTRGYASKVNAYIIPELGRIKLDKLTGERVEAFYDSLRARGLSEGSVRGTHAILRRAMVLALRRGLLIHNVVADRVEPPSSVTQQRPMLTVDQAWAVLNTAGDNPRAWVALLAGLRQGEALALRWNALALDAVDEDGNPTPYLEVRENVARKAGGGVVFGPPKSRAGERVVPLLPQVAERLEALRVARKARPSDLVFPNPAGTGPRDPHRDWSDWKTLLTQAGVPDVTLHSARQTCAQLLQSSGVPDRVVADILGHSQVTMTHHYQRGNTVATVAAVRSLGAYLEERRPKPRPVA